MGRARTLIEPGQPGSGEFQTHVEAGRSRGALSTVLVVPRRPSRALAQALRTLHDPRGPLALDERLGALAGGAPSGTAFLVELEGSVWAFPSERIQLVRRRDGAEERLLEPQVLRLVPGDRITVIETATGEELACLLSVAVPGVAALPVEEAPVEPAPAGDGRPAWIPPRRSPVRRRIALAGGALVVVVAIVAGIRRSGSDRESPRTDAFTPPTLEQRVVDLLASGPRADAGGATQPAAVQALGDESAGQATRERGGESRPEPDAALAVAVPWEFRAGGAITSSPLLLDGKLIFGCRDGHLYCLDAASGEVVWSLPTATGIGSSPQAVAGLVVVGTYGGKLLAVRRDTGEVAWEALTEGRIVSSPCVTGRTVIVGSYDGQVHAFAADTGDRIWARAAGAAVRASGELVGGDGVVIGAGNGRLLHLAVADGTVRWERTFPTAVHAQALWDAERNSVYVGTQGGDAECLVADTGESRWSVRLGAEVNAQPRLAGGSVLFGTGKGVLRALDPVTGDTRWTARAERGFDARPLVVDAVVVAPSFDGTVHLLDVASGEVRSRQSMASEVFSSPAAGTDLLYVGTMGGTLHALPLP